jgi:hypothetical protein
VADRPIHPHYVVGIDGIFATSIVATPKPRQSEPRENALGPFVGRARLAMAGEERTSWRSSLPGNSCRYPTVIRSLPFSRRGKRTSPCLPPLLPPELVTLAATCLREGGDGGGTLATSGMLGLYRLCVPLIFHSLELYPVSQLPPPAGNAFMLMRKCAFAVSGRGGGYDEWKSKDMPRGVTLVYTYLSAECSAHFAMNY